MATWILTVNGAQYGLDIEDADDLRREIVDACRAGGDWVTVFGASDARESLEVLITPSTQVTLRLEGPPYGPAAVPPL